MSNENGSLGDDASSFEIHYASINGGTLEGDITVTDTGADGVDEGVDALEAEKGELAAEIQQDEEVFAEFNANVESELAEAQAKQQMLLAQARADAAMRLAEAMETNPQAAEAIRLLLAGDWMAMGEAMANAQGGSVLMVDPQSPASLLTALKGLQKPQG